MEEERTGGQGSSLRRRPQEEHPLEGGLAKGLASNTISRRGALKLLGGTALGLLVLPVLPSTALGAGTLQPALKTSSLGTFSGVQYVQYDGLFVGETSRGNYRVPYRISAPANPRRANRTVLVEPPHFAAGTELGNSSLGRPYLFGRRFLHASVAYSTASLGEPSMLGSILDPVTQDSFFIDGGVVLPGEDGLGDDEIIIDFARALASDPVAQTLMGAVKQRYLAGLSQSAQAVKRIVASGQAEGVFDLVVPVTTDNIENLLAANDPQKAIADGRYSGKVITVQSEFEWPAGRTLEDRGDSPDQYRSFFVAGTPHVPDYLCSPHFANKTTPAGWQPALRAHFLQGHAWVTKGEVPPTSTRLATTTIGGVTEVIAHDATGNAQVVDITGKPAPRLPYVELGEAKFTTGFTGTYAPQPPPTIEQLGFSGFNEYLAKFEAALDAQVQDGYMLDEDAQVLLKRAGLSSPATFTENYFARYEEFQSGEYCP
ncbi:MAG: alpha/beta hydrolase domain-containing protein [Actinomycetota bacterium]|nr:alpha/beta hydrolase domain-containing protein [Actinomycetota bacterium]